MGRRVRNCTHERAKRFSAAGGFTSLTAVLDKVMLIENNKQKSKPLYFLIKGDFVSFSDFVLAEAIDMFLRSCLSVKLRVDS